MQKQVASAFATKQCYLRKNVCVHFQICNSVSERLQWQQGIR